MLRRLISLVVVTSLLGGVAAVTVFGPRLFDRVLPTAALDLVAGLVGPKGLVGGGGGGGETVTAGMVPADFLVDGADGLVATGPIAATVGNQPVFIRDVLAGYPADVRQAIPATVITMRPILGCLLTPPQPGSLVGYASGSGTSQPMALVSYDDANLATGVADFVERYRKRGIAAPVPGDAFAFQAQDVVVTETATPVYLVLESGGGNRIWNIHLAEGARIERVVLLGGAQSGVANLDPVVPVEVILDDGLGACGIRPAYPLNAGHRLVQPAEAGLAASSGAKAAVAANAEAVAAYDIWFRDAFGVRASEARVGFAAGTVAVIGPTPADAGSEVSYAPIVGADIRTTEATYFEIVGQVEAGQDYGGRVMTLATGFAFGDLSILRQGVGF